MGGARIKEGFLEEEMPKVRPRLLLLLLFLAVPWSLTYPF